jgi:hypothetical protein
LLASGAAGGFAVPDVFAGFVWLEVSAGTGVVVGFIAVSITVSSSVTALSIVPLAATSGVTATSSF